MTTSTCADGSGSHESLLPHEPPGSSAAGPDPSAHVPTVTCPHCEGEPLDGHEVGVYCLACNGSGRVCSWCRGKLGAEFCNNCGSTAAHRTTWASLDLWAAAYDPCSWEGLARRAGEQAERFRVELSEARSQLTSMRTERDLLRRQVETAQHEVRLACEKAQRKIDEMHREHRAEVEDLQRQLRLASRRIVGLKTERAA